MGEKNFLIGTKIDSSNENELRFECTIFNIVRIKVKVVIKFS